MCMLCWFHDSWLTLPRADERSLEHYKINAGATIHMVLQLRGGFVWMVYEVGLESALFSFGIGAEQ